MRTMILPLISLLLGAFCIGTTELVIAGLLPAIAADLDVSIARAGLLITGYAIGVAIGGPAMMAVAGRWPRKRGLLAVMTLFLLAHLACAAASGFAALMLWRLVAAAAHGCFFGFAIILATGNVPPERRATALSIVVGGISLANIIGVPLGTAIGNAYGWRAAFLMIAAFTAVAGVAIAAFVPDAAAGQSRAPLGQQMRALMNRTVVTAYGMIVLQMIAFFGMISFIAPYLDEVAGVGPDRLPGVLLVIGLTGAVGMFGGGWLTDLNPGRSLIAGYALATLAMAVVWLATPHAAVAGIAALALVGTVGSVATLAAQHRVLVGSLRAPELSSTLMSSVFNVGIATGAGLSAWAVAAGVPFRALPLIGVVALASATVLAIVSVIGDRRYAIA